MKEYGMRCRKHLCDRSSTVGVCASCIRERLLLLLLAHQIHHPHHHSSPDSPPQSASPSLNSISTAATWQTNATLRRLCSANERSTQIVDDIHDEKKQQQQRRNNNSSMSGKLSSFILGIFRSKLGKPKSEQEGPISDAFVSNSSYSDSSSWFSNSFLRRRTDNLPLKSNSRCYEDGGSSEVSSVSYRDWIQKQQRTMRRRGGKKAAAAAKLGRNGSAMTLCLNPLICTGAGKDRRRPR